ncbi:MAG: 23S rRNA (adenine(2503)-C(2))-methyltransferase RlmN [Clostridiaceae bacterium]|nr:23S rRNA (adenine(2503)-C(2))-methyltransferase RlmN [Clostridiaceae bacterium]
MNNILDFNLLELKIWMKEQGESEFRAKQVMDFLYKEVWDFDAIKNIPSSTKEKLKKSFFIGIPEIVEVLCSKEDETKKLLIKFADGNLIETVIMKYKHGYSVCVSTQVGCRMGCKFCASTINGMVRNLSSGEILAQVLVAQKEIGSRVSNVVLMGSGEPLDNYDNVIKFLELVNAEYGLNIGQRHITLSTCGIVPKIFKLSELKLQITLAISLHSAEDNLRKTMMPIANKYTIDEIIDACKNYIKMTNKRITFEYALVKGVNDSIEDAKKLSRILIDLLCHVNLIPINEIQENTFKSTTKEHIVNFSKVLLDFGIETTVRREMGSDINAACGQLRRSYLETKKNGGEGYGGDSN